MKFVQNTIDSVNGRSAARKDKARAERELAEALENARQKELARIDKTYGEETYKLGVFAAELLDNITTLEEFKNNIKKVADAMIACAGNNILPLEEILKDSSNHFVFSNIINCHPIHMLLTMHMFHNVDTKASIIKLLTYESLDYQVHYYGVSPVAEMLKIGGELKTAALNRISKDIIKACQCHNFSQALTLIAYDFSYFKSAKILEGFNGNILDYASNMAKNFKAPQELFWFMNKLINEDQFVSLNQNPLPLSKLAMQQSFNHLYKESKSLVAERVKSFKVLELDGYVLEGNTKAEREYSYKNHEFLYKAKKNMRLQARMSPADIAKVHFNQDLTSIEVKDLNNVSIYFCYFLKDHIFSTFTSVSFINCQFDNNVAMSIFSYLETSPSIQKITVQGCNINDTDTWALFEALKFSKSVRKITLECNANLTAKTLDTFVEIIKHRGNSKDCFTKCALQVSGINVAINPKAMIDIYEHALSRNVLEEISCVWMDNPAPLFTFLAKALEGNNLILKSIELIRVKIDAPTASSLAKIIKNSSNLKNILIADCQIDFVARTILKAVNLEALSSQNNSQLKTVYIKNSGFNLNVGPKTLKPSQKVLAALFNGLQTYAADFTSNKPRSIDKLKNLLSLNLTEQEFLTLKNTFIKAKNNPLLSSVSRKLLFAKHLLLMQAKAELNSFFDKYVEELKSIEVSKWSGSSIELAIIARLLSCRIHLHHGDYSPKAQKIYGYESWDKDIHLVRQGHAFYGYCQQKQAIIPNASDDLNLFRACIHASLAQDKYEHWINKSFELEQCAKQLQADTIDLVQHSREICEQEYKDLLLRYLETKSVTEMYLVARDLPQLNLQVMQKFVSTRNMLNAITELTKLASSCSILQKDEYEKLLALLESLFKVQQTKPRIYDLSMEVGDSLDIAKLNITKIKEIFENDRNLRCSKLAEAITNNKNTVAEIDKTYITLAAAKIEEVKKLNEAIAKCYHDGQHDINHNYDARRRKDKDNLVKVAVAGGLSFVVGNFFGPMLQGFLGSTSGLGLGLSAVNAKLASQAIISSIVSQTVYGGRLGQLPENILKSFAAGKLGTIVTDAVMDAHVHNLSDPTINIDINKARVITVVHKTIETVGLSAINGNNPLQDGIATAVATAVASTALNVDHRNSNHSPLLFNTGTGALQATFLGLDGDEILQAAAMQALGSGAFAATEQAVNMTPLRGFPDAVENSNANSQDNRRPLVNRAPTANQNNNQQVAAHIESNAQEHIATQDNANLADNERLPRTGTAIMASGVVNHATREITEKFNRLTPITRHPQRAAHKATTLRKIDNRKVQAEQYVLAEMYGLPEANISIWNKALNILISPAYASESPYETSIKRSREINAFNRLIANVHGLKKPSFDPYGDVPEENRCYVFSPQYIQEIESAYRKISALEYANSKIQSKNIALFTAGIAASVPVTLVNAFATSDNYLRTGEMPEYTPNERDIQAVESTVTIIKNIPHAGLKPVLNAYCRQYNDRLAEAKRYQMNGNSFMAGFTVGSAHVDVIIDAASLLGGGVGAVKVLPTVGKVATKSIIFSANQALRQSKKVYLMGSMGPRKVSTALALTEYLNSAPIASELGSGLCATAPRQFLFSQIDITRSKLSSLRQGAGKIFYSPGEDLLFSRSAKIDFAATEPFLNGKLFPFDMVHFTDYMRKRGVDVLPLSMLPPGERFPGFRARSPYTGKPTLYLPENPTVLEVKHELSHWLDYKKLGLEMYANLSTLEKEQMVLDRLKNNRIWKQELNEEERIFSKDYVEQRRLEDKLLNKNGVKHVD